MQKTVLMQGGASDKGLAICKDFFSKGVSITCVDAAENLYKIVAHNNGGDNASRL